MNHATKATVKVTSLSHNGPSGVNGVSALSVVAWVMRLVSGLAMAIRLDHEIVHGRAQSAMGLARMSLVLSGRIGASGAHASR